MQFAHSDVETMWGDFGNYRQRIAHGQLNELDSIVFVSRRKFILRTSISRQDVQKKKATSQYDIDADRNLQGIVDPCHTILQQVDARADDTRRPTTRPSCYQLGR